MDNRSLSTFNSKRKRILILLGAVVILLVLIGLYRISLINSFIWNLIDAYLTFLEQIADRLLHSIGSEVSIQNHKVYVGSQINGIIASGYLLKKWTLFLLIICWITPTKVIHKLVFTSLIMLSNFIGSLSHISLSAHLLSFDNTHTTSFLGRTPYALLMLFLFINLNLIWRSV